MKRAFTYSDEKSNKFWSIDIDGNSFTVNYGKTGTAGQIQTKSFADAAECRIAADKLIAEKTKKGYVESDSSAQNTGKTALKILEEKYKEKYKDIDDDEISSYYYGEGNAMDRVLEALQKGIKKGVKEFNKIRDNYEDDEFVDIFIDEDKYEIVFSVDEEFYTHFVGEAMVEALVLMDKMAESGISTGLRQALNNWAEDLNFSGFGAYEVSDSWEMIEGFEGYDEEDDENDDENEDDEESDNEVNFDSGTGFCLQDMVMNKETLQLIIITYDKANKKLLLQDTGAGLRVFEYDSPDALVDAVTDLNKHYALGKFAGESKKIGFGIDTLIKMYQIKPEKPVDIFSLFRAKGELSPAEKALEKEKTIPCKKLVFFKNILDMKLLFCDESGKRILDPAGSGKYLQAFECREDALKAFEKMKDIYIKKGYELIQEEIVDYPFEHSLKVIKQANGK